MVRHTPHKEAWTRCNNLVPFSVPSLGCWCAARVLPRWTFSSGRVAYHVAYIEAVGCVSITVQHVQRQCGFRWASSCVAAATYVVDGAAVAGIGLAVVNIVTAVATSLVVIPLAY